MSERRFIRLMGIGITVLLLLGLWWIGRQQYKRVYQDAVATIEQQQQNNAATIEADF